MEKAVCADPELANMDRLMAAAYAEALAAAGNDKALMRTDQRQWLAHTGDNCSGNGITDCLKGAYSARLKELNAAAASPATAITEYRFTRVSKDFDFVLRMLAHKPDDMDGYREGPGYVAISRKGEKTPLQTIRLENIWVSFDAKGAPLSNTAPLYDDQGAIQVGDFNFDGQEDFAVQNGNNGSYGLPSYSVFLYSRTERQFKLSEPLSELTVEGLGFFGVDARSKHLVVLSKSGCCYHQTTEYEIRNDLPVPFSREVEDGTREEGYLYISNERFIDGGWKGSKKRVKEKPEENPK